MPSIYLLTRKSKKLIFANQRQDKIRLDQIMHDVTVLDVAICIMKSLGIKAEDMKTEKQLHQQKRLWRKNPSARHCIHKG